MSWTSSIQSVPPHPTSWRSILILSLYIHLGLPSGSFPQLSPPKHCIQPSSLHTCYMPRLSHSFRFDHPKNIGWGVLPTVILLLIICIFVHPEFTVSVKPTFHSFF
jgi:hypothetical protein